MKTELIDVSPTRKEIKIEIEPAQITKRFRSHQPAIQQGAQTFPAFVPDTRPLQSSALVTKARSEAKCCASCFPKLLTTPSSSIRSTRSASLTCSLTTLKLSNSLGEEPLTLKVGCRSSSGDQTRTYKGLEADTSQAPDHRRRRRTR